MLRSGTGIWERGVMGKHGEIAGPGVGYPIPRHIYHGIYHQCVFFNPNACTETERRIVLRAPTKKQRQAVCQELLCTHWMYCAPAKLP